MLLISERTLVVAFEYGHPVTATARKWLTERFPATIGHAKSVRTSPYLCARNIAVRDVVLPEARLSPAERQFDFALFIDNDVTPTVPGTDAFLEIDADIAACECRMATTGAWDGPAAFHTPLWWARLDVFLRVPPPWFQFGYSDDGCQLIECDCLHFARKAVAAGFRIGHGGHCGHNAEGQWHGCG